MHDNSSSNKVKLISVQGAPSGAPFSSLVFHGGTCFNDGGMPGSDARKAFVISWMIAGLGMSLAVGASFLLTAESAAGILPPCESRIADGRPCPLCGMTTGFIHISRGRFDEARRANAMSLPLYALFVVNALAALAVAARFLRRRPSSPPWGAHAGH
jgi:hypothetical protein